MIRAENLTFTYSTLDSSVLKRTNFKLEPGKFALVCGPTGSGKSTLLKTLNGLSPNFTGGTVSGNVVVEGESVIGRKPNQLAHLIGYVNQQPDGAFVADTVEDELAYGMEQLGFSREEMKTRVSEIAEKLNITELLGRGLTELSGGQQQRVAIGAAIAAGQKLILLDEPTSALDDQAAAESLELLKRLCINEGITVVIAEHRVERVLKYADSVISVHRDGSVTHQRREEANLDSGPETTQRVSTATDEITFSAKSLQQTYKDLVALSPTDLELRAGSVTGVSGANGAGKSSLLWAIVEDAWRQKLPIAMVPQNATDLLFLNSVSAELAEADRFAQQAPNSSATILESLIGRIDPKLHPRDLSSGQQLALALSVQLIRETAIVLLDEPTRGLDAAAKSELASLIDRLASRGISVVIATHDQNFLNRISDQIITLELGTVVNISG